VDAGEALTAGVVFTTAEAADLKYMANNTTGDSLVLQVADQLGNTAAGTYSVGVDNVAPTVTVNAYTVAANSDQPIIFNYVDTGDMSKVKVSVVSVGSSNGIFYVEHNGVAGYQGGADTYIYDQYTAISLDDVTSGRIHYKDNGSGNGESLTLRIIDGAGHQVDVTVAPTAPSIYHIEAVPTPASATQAWWEQPGLDLSYVRQAANAPHVEVSRASVAAVQAVVPAHVLEEALLAKVLGESAIAEHSAYDHAFFTPAATQLVDFGMHIDAVHSNPYLELLHLAHAGQG
jgi:hypothetical protein